MYKKNKVDKIVVKQCNIF